MTDKHSYYRKIVEIIAENLLMKKLLKMGNLPTGALWPSECDEQDSASLENLEQMHG